MFFISLIIVHCDQYRSLDRAIVTGCRHVCLSSRPVAKNFQVGVLSLRVLGPGESEARRVEGDGVLGEGFTPPHQLGR